MPYEEEAYKKSKTEQKMYYKHTSRRQLRLVVVVLRHATTALTRSRFGSEGVGY